MLRIRSHIGDGSRPGTQGRRLVLRPIEVGTSSASERPMPTPIAPFDAPSQHPEIGNDRFRTFS